MKASVLTTVVAGITVSLLAACAPTPPRADPPPPPPPPPPTADQLFEALAQRYLKEAPEQAPVSATALGDHRFDDRWSDWSEAGRVERLAFVDRWEAAFDALDPATLSPDDVIDRDLILGELDAAERFAALHHQMTAQDGDQDLLTWDRFLCARIAALRQAPGRVLACLTPARAEIAIAGAMNAAGNSCHHPLRPWSCSRFVFRHRLG